MRNRTPTETDPLVAEVVDTLIADGWSRQWAAVDNAVRDEYGNAASIHYRAGRDDSVTVEFSYALPGGPIEIMHLSPEYPERVAKIISAASEPAL